MIATTIIQPIDMVKVRIQLGAQGSPFKVASDIIAKDGTFVLLLCVVSLLSLLYTCLGNARCNVLTNLCRPTPQESPWD